MYARCRLIHKHPYRQNPVLHFYSGLLTLVVARPSDVPVAISAEGFALSALVADADQGASEAEEGDQGAQADATRDADGDETMMHNSQSKARSRARAPTFTAQVTKKRGIALGASAVTVRSLPTSTLANAKRNFRACIMRAVSGGAAGAGSETEASASEAGTTGAESGSGAVGFQTDARLDNRVDARTKEAKRKREAAIKGHAKALGLAVSEQKDARSQSEAQEPDSELPEDDTDRDTTMGSYIPGLQSRKRRRASSADIDEYSSEDEVDPRDQPARPEPDSVEEMHSLLIRQRRMLKAGNQQLESERREEEERQRAEQAESVYERDSDEEQDEDGQSNKVKSHYWGSQGMWAVELARVYVELVRQRLSSTHLQTCELNKPHFTRTD